MTGTMDDVKTDGRGKIVSGVPTLGRPLTLFAGKTIRFAHQGDVKTEGKIKDRGTRDDESIAECGMK